MIKGITLIHPIITANSKTNPYIIYPLVRTRGKNNLWATKGLREVGFLIRCSADYGWIQLGSIKNDLNAQTLARSQMWTMVAKQQLSCTVRASQLFIWSCNQNIGTLASTLFEIGRAA